MQRIRSNLSPGRLASLALMGVIIVALLFARFASRDHPIAVPDGATAGKLSLAPCEYAAEDGDLPADCGTLVVPENRADPGSHLIALPVTRIRAAAPTGARPVFHLDGGPGHTNMEFPPAGRIARDRDVVLLGYRGVDGSVRLDCPEVVSALKHAKDFLDDETLDSYASAVRDCAARLSGEGIDLRGYTLSQRADDVEDARVALGYGQVDLLSESAGTRLAMIYGWRHPSSVGRSVMIGANPPGHFVWDAAASDAQIALYATRCANEAGCAARTVGLASTLATAVRHTPGRWLFLPIKSGNARLATFYALMESGATSAPMNGPMALDAWLASGEGDASGLWMLSLLSDIVFPQSFVWGDMASVAMADNGAAQRYFASGTAHDSSILGNPATEFLWARGRLVGAWPNGDADREYAQLRRSDIETLLVNGELDGATPQEGARELLPFLPNGHQVVLDGIGHTIDFWAQQRPAADRLVNAFLESGEVDASQYTASRVEFAPVMSAPAIAKIVAGSAAGLPLLALLSLVLVGATRNSIGRRTGAALRALWPALLGPGGWLAATLVILSAWPGVPLDDPLLVTLSMGVPVGLGVLLAAAGRHRTGLPFGLEFATTMAATLVGAWLGHAAGREGVVLVTTMVGATIGANLALTGIDVLADSAGADPVSQGEVRSMEVHAVTP